jgi:26S proteasome regulatory subunit N6
VLLEDAGDVPAIVSGKLALKYSGRAIEAMQALATASLDRSLAAFEKALSDYKPVSQRQPA